MRFFDASEVTHGTKKAIKIDDFTYGQEFKKSEEKIIHWKDVLEIIIDRASD